MTILYFVVALGVLVFIHEFGHFIVAKKIGIGVEKFSLGFGPKLFSFTRGETTYMVSALPLGGYVKLTGEDPDAEDAKGKKSFSARSIPQRALVVFAGPFMNLLLALLIMPVVLMIGRWEPVFLQQKPIVVGVRKDSPAEKAGLRKGDEILAIDGKSYSNWKEVLDFTLIRAKQPVEVQVKRGDRVFSEKMTIVESPDTHAGMLGLEPSYFIGNEPVIDQVAPDGPAETAGLKVGDEVVQIDGSPIETWSEMSEKVGKNGGKKVEVTVRRGDELVTVSVTPRFDAGMRKWLMGVQKDTGKRGEAFVKRKYPFGQAIIQGTEENIKLVKLTFSVLGRLVTFKLSYKTLGGPIRIAQASAMAAKSGAPDFLYFLAFLSIQLGVLNLLPFPVLDGGHLLFFGIEEITRKPVSARVRGYAEQAGFFLLIFLMVMVTMNDIQSVWDVGKILQKVKSLF
jgi:regulator of sigma E protease